MAQHHPQWARESNSISLVSPNQTIDQLTLVLARAPEQQAAFEQFLADQQNPDSPEYHHWLTPAEVGTRFGLATQDMDNITGWLQAQGLSVDWIAPSKTFIGFSGKAADIDRAFQTELKNYRVNNTDRMSVATDPMIPVALAPAIKAIDGLYTIEDHPTHHLGRMETASPNVTTPNGKHYIGPADFATIYNLPSNLRGYGYTIGIVGRARTNRADLQNFMSKTNTSFNLPTEVIPTAFGGVDPGPALTAPPTSGDAGEQGEATLDVTRAGSVAPGANLLLVVATSKSGGIRADAQYLVNTTPVPAQIMNISFGNCESAAGSSGVSYWDTLFQQAAAEGISIFVSSGDAGASGCDANFDTPPANPAPNSPNYICSSSYATCVGGTEFADTSSPSLYWSSGNSTGLSSALRYIPEGGWNDPLDSNSNPTVASSGGGVSSFIATPSWQTGTGVPTDRAGRYTPDISFAGACHDGYFGCFAAGGASCVTQSGGGYSFTSFCGTSASAPDLAGITALLDQKKGAAQGNLNPALYATAASTPNIFHDVTVATSGVSNCNVNTPSMCNNSIPSPTALTGGQAGYLVADGYDLVTGLGSMDVSAFINGVGIKATPAVTISVSGTTIAVADKLSLYVIVSSSQNATPTGSVTASDGTYTSAATPLVGEFATISIPEGSLSTGSHTITVTYTPDSNSSTTFNTASQAVAITVIQSRVDPPITEALSASTISTTQSLTITVTVSGSANFPAPTGSVDLSGFADLQPRWLSSNKAIFTLPAGLLTAGTYSIPANFTPDPASAVYYNNVSTSASFTITGQISPSLTVTPAYANVATAQTLQVQVTTQGPAISSPKPTGSITLSDGHGYSSPASTLVNGSTIITVPAGTLQTGTASLTATYAPDAKGAPLYSANSTMGFVTVWNVPKASPVIRVTPSSSTIITTDVLPVYISLAGAGGFPTVTGTVTLTAGSYTSPATSVSISMTGTSSAAFMIPGGSLSPGNTAITVSYSPDSQSDPIFTAGNGTVPITVNPPAPASFALGGTAVTLSAGATIGNTSTITLTPSGGFTGSVTLTAEITSSPSGAQHLPTVTFTPNNPVSIAGRTAVTATMKISTTAATTSAQLNPSESSLRWYAAGGATLACVLICVPRRKRYWRTTLGVMALLVLLAGGMTACGGGTKGTSGGGSSGTTTDPGTTKGAYVITVTGTSGSTTASTVVNLTVQ